jgi:hypothetical protein
MKGGNGREPRDGPEPGQAGPPSAFAELVLEIVDELADVSRTDGDATVWHRAGRPFASLAGDVLEVRLQPPVARAALRTPDTQVSARGEPWVRFSPSELDRFAADRAAAWLESAWRHAAD